MFSNRKMRIREKFSPDDFKDVYATARMAHTGQKRRSGEDYFTHPSEVRNIVRNFYPEDKISQLAALLHDTLEDAPGDTVSSVEEMEGFIRGSISQPDVADEVIRVVRALTHEKGGDYTSYVAQLMTDQPALRVKLADMVHNLSSSPGPRQKQKYRTAIEAISAHTDGQPPRGISKSHWEKLFALTEAKMKNINNKNLRAMIRDILIQETLGPNIPDVVGTVTGVQGEDLRQILHISQSVVDRGGYLLQIATALQDRGFEADLIFSGVLAVGDKSNPEKFFVGKSSAFDIDSNEEVYQVGPYVIGRNQ